MKAVTCKGRKSPHQELNQFDLRFAASGMMKNTYLLFQFLSLLYFMLWQPEHINIVCTGAPVVIGTKDLG